MQMHLILVILVNFSLLFPSNKTKKEEVPMYIQYLQEIEKKFAIEMRNEFGLEYIGNGGQLSKDVDHVDVDFISDKHLNLEEARKIEVKSIERLVQLINEDEKIRPYLREYPFSHKRVTILIGFKDSKGKALLDGSIATMYSARGKIFYNKAKLKKVVYAPTYSNKMEVLYPEKITEEVRLEDYYEEPYEEAVRKVREK